MKSCASSSSDSKTAPRSMATPSTRTYRNSSYLSRYLAKSICRPLLCNQRRVKMPKNHKFYRVTRLIWNTIGWYTYCPFLSSRIRKSTKPSSLPTSWHHATVCTSHTKFASSSAIKRTKSIKSAKITTFHKPWFRRTKNSFSIIWRRQLIWPEMSTLRGVFGTSSSTNNPTFN